MAAKEINLTKCINVNMVRGRSNENFSTQTLNFVIIRSMANIMSKLCGHLQVPINHNVGIMF